MQGAQQKHNTVKPNSQKDLMMLINQQVFSQTTNAMGKNPV
jgi:hypothetical protein